MTPRPIMRPGVLTKGAGDALEIGVVVRDPRQPDRETVLWLDVEDVQMIVAATARAQPQPQKAPAPPRQPAKAPAPPRPRPRYGCDPRPAPVRCNVDFPKWGRAPRINFDDDND